LIEWQLIAESTGSHQFSGSGGGVKPSRLPPITKSDIEASLLRGDLASIDDHCID
jgi:hypothetical protein